MSSQAKEWTRTLSTMRLKVEGGTKWSQIIYFSFEVKSNNSTVLHCFTSLLIFSIIRSNIQILFFHKSVWLNQRNVVKK